jgi:hypothetical protein
LERMRRISGSLRGRRRRRCVDLVVDLVVDVDSDGNVDVAARPSRSGD